MMKIPNLIQEFNSFFDKLWHDESNTIDVKENMLEQLKTLYKENSPEFVYYLTLYQMFKDILINQDDYTRIKEKNWYT